MSQSQQLQQLKKQLWNIANDLRGKMGADEFRDYILGFIFYKYLSDKFIRFANNILAEEGEVAFLTTLIVSGVTAGTLNPDLPKDQTVEVASNLLMDAVKSYAENSDGVSESVQVEDVRYGVSINEMTGVWMFFEAKKD